MTQDTSINSQKTRMNFQLDETISAEFMEKCKLNDTTASRAMRDFISDYLDDSRQDRMDALKVLGQALCRIRSLAVDAGMSNGMSSRDAAMAIYQLADSLRNLPEAISGDSCYELKNIITHVKRAERAHCGGGVGFEYGGL